MRRLAAALALLVAGCGGEIPKPRTTIAEAPKKPAFSAAEVDRVLLLPRPDRLAIFRRWIEQQEPRLAFEGAVQLARLRDSAPLIVALVARIEDHAAVALLSSALLEFPRSEVGAAAQALKKKLAVATSVDRAQLAVALIHVGDTASFPSIVRAHREDDLASARTLDGVPAFDRSALASFADHATWRTLAKDDSARVRALSAIALSLAPEVEDDQTLAALIADPDLTVATEAAVGAARKPLPLARLMLTKRALEFEKQDDAAARQRLVAALARRLGGAGLLFALETGGPDDDESRARLILERVRALRDPSAAPAYKSYLANAANPPHYRAQIALSLGELGDADALPHLAARMTAKGIGFHCGANKSPQCLSSNLGWKREPPIEADPVMHREQTSSAQLIGDLTLLHPARRAQFLAVAGPPLEQFDSWFPAPWLVTTRARTFLGDPKSAARAKKTVLSFKVSTTLDAPTLLALSTFARAARYVGRGSDPAMLAALQRHLDGLSPAAQYAAEAAIDALAEWGPEASPAIDHLLEVVRDPRQGAVARTRAGRALGRIASSAQLLGWVRDARAWKDNDARVAVLAAAHHRGDPDLAAAALEYLVKTNDPAVLAWAARVVGAADVSALAPKLLALLDDRATRPFAALAIILGGDVELVTRGMLTFAARAKLEGRWEQERSTLRVLLVDTFDHRELVRDDLPRLSRVAHNVDRMRRIGAVADIDEKGRGPHAWAALALEEALARVELGISAPGALDRALLFDEARRAGDVRLLRYLGETGALFAFDTEPARAALRELRPGE